MSFLVPLLGLILGILTGDMVGNPVLSLIPVGISLSVYYFILHKTVNPIYALKFNKWHKIWIIFLFFGIGWLSITLGAPEKLRKDVMQRYTHVEGKVVESLSSAEGERLIVDVIALHDINGHRINPVNFKLRIVTDGFYAAPGDLLYFPAKILELQDSHKFRSTGYAKSMRRKGVLYTSKVPYDSIKYLGKSKGFNFLASKYKTEIEILIEKSRLNRDCKAFCIALLLGDQANVEAGHRQKFSNTGIAHILALSGTHITLIMSFLLLLTYPFQFLGGNKLRIIICILLIWIFTFFTGGASSTVRASLMITFSTLAFFLQRKTSPANTLFIVTFVILLLSPSALFDIGLQLSVLSVGGILLLGSKIKFTDKHLNPVLKFILNSSWITLVATITTWTVISYYFGIIPIFFLPTNLLILPLLPIFMTASFFYVILLMFGIEWIWLTDCVNLIYTMIANITDFFSNIKGSVIEFRASLLVVSLWMTGLGYIIYLLEETRRKRFYFIGMAYLAVVCLLAKYLSPTAKDGIIFQNYHHQISIVYYQGPHEHMLLFPRRHNSEVTLSNIRILVLDSIFSEEDVDHFLTSPLSKEKQMYLILGNGSRITSRDEIYNANQFHHIILHPTLYRKSEESLIGKDHKEEKKNYYSLREEGPLEIIF